ncbi:proliferation marker protein Ki-67 [Lepus europaeus]|uniref:proliferation marker protein Ki-67 n=1 Tax=Lepus europaeus TaxID=9983 RepID=UPI002B48720C|nr:proliferation marker protein Ki-67 [Lepus europaeus]
MGPGARLVTIRRSGADGAHFPLSLRACSFGRGIECDIRIQLPVVSKQHCKIEIIEQEAVLYNFSSTNPTKVNGSIIDGPVQLKHGDLITIVDRSFRYENESHQNGNKSPKFSGKNHEQEPSRCVSRSGISSEPDSRDQDSKPHSKITEGDVSGRPLVRVKNATGDGCASEGSEDSIAQEMPHVHSSEHPGHRDSSAGASTSEEFKESSRVAAVSCGGELEPLPSTRCLDSSRKEDSPFKKLYQSMKEELRVNSQTGNALQYHKKSGSQVDFMTDKASSDDFHKENQQLGSGKSRLKCGRRSLVKTASPALGSSREQQRGVDSAQSHGTAKSPCTPLSEMTQVKTPVRCSQQNSQKRKHEDPCAIDGREPENLDTSEGFKADDKTVSPGRLLTRKRTPIKAEETSRSDKAENLSSRNRRVPANVHILPTDTEIQNQPVAQWLTPVEKKIEKGSPHKPEQLGPTAGQISSGLPGLSSVDINNFGDSINKSEGMSLKRRRVSFGGRLRPELFDENLPPNTPLKRGETPTRRKSLATQTPAVLKKIIKENPQPSGKESSEISLELTTRGSGSPAPSPPVANDQRRRSCRASSASGGGRSPQQTGFPKKGGRKSGSLPSKRTSISRSQHDILQMICSKRRSGASEANLIVAKSWADVVKLGAKQAQTKVVKHVPQRQVNKRPRRPNTPKKTAENLHNQFSTGHANSPCTIVIGRAHVEKVSAPARPYRMLNNFVFNNRKMDFNEDLSGLTEMFKTPVKEKPEINTCPITLSNSENLLGKKLEVTISGEKPLPPTLANFGWFHFFPIRTNQNPKKWEEVFEDAAREREREREALSTGKAEANRTSK